MPGATLSRWTMSYFAAACLFLLIGEVMMVTGCGYPVVAIDAPETLALVHVLAIGWLSLLMVGALLQFVPVLVAAPLRGRRLALPVLLLLVTGLLLLAGGFGALAGVGVLSPAMLPLGALLLVTGFGLAAAMLAATLFAARPLPLPARFVGLGLLALVATALIGAAFALALSGTVATGPLIRLLVHGVPLHAASGLGGWLTLTAVGVSYRLLPMFMLAPEEAHGTSHFVWWVGSAALALVAARTAWLVLDASAVEEPLALAALLAAAAVILYCADVIRLFRERRRRAVELNIRASYAAFAALLLSVVLFIIPGTRAAAGEGAAALVYLFVFGWLTGLGLAQLYKIVPFLTWLECYGTVLGRAAVPRVQDLVREGRSSLWFCLYYGAVTAATGSLFAGSAPWFRAALLLQLVATVGLTAELVRARMLSSVAEPLRFPLGAPRPNLFLPISRQQE
ncbi:hypothetical protein [Sinorhizobium americanum]|uniref:Uncharacterized protein n=1 Tax=Sinorhizobium americanum TaxID=194963 RepID=A0A1L3LKK0_9HYPH|nr:hypothetical protein [Sinorhizobium americanum]APG90629.1 hypothetical protein SAMCFNEI73_Ch1318 [Sinorhizobium americanum]OAP48286.1 hypothetical protein ATC00_18530 [Sinorhizobium americanum]